MLILLLFLIIGLCFCIFNYWFQKEKYEHMTFEEIDRLNKLNSPVVWGICSCLLFLAILGIITYYIYNMMLAIKGLN